MKLYFNVYDKGTTVCMHYSREAADNAANDDSGDDREECLESSLELIKAAPELREVCYTVLDLATKEKSQDAIEEIIKLMKRVTLKLEGKE